MYQLFATGIEIQRDSPLWVSFSVFFPNRTKEHAEQRSLSEITLALHMDDGKTTLLALTPQHTSHSVFAGCSSEHLLSHHSTTTHHEWERRTFELQPRTLYDTTATRCHTIVGISLVCYVSSPARERLREMEEYKALVGDIRIYEDEEETFEIEELKGEVIWTIESLNDERRRRAALLKDDEEIEDVLLRWKTKRRRPPIKTEVDVVEEEEEESDGFTAGECCEIFDGDHNFIGISYSNIYRIRNVVLHNSRTFLVRRVSRTGTKEPLAQCAKVYVL